MSWRQLHWNHHTPWSNVFVLYTFMNHVTKSIPMSLSWPILRMMQTCSWGIVTMMRLSDFALIWNGLSCSNCLRDKCMMMHYNAQLCTMMHYNALWCTVHYDALCTMMHYDALRTMIHYDILCTTMHYDALWCTVHYDALWCTAHYDTLWYSMHYDALCTMQNIRCIISQHNKTCMGGTITYILFSQHTHICTMVCIQSIRVIIIFVVFKYLIKSKTSWEAPHVSNMSNSHIFITWAREWMHALTHRVQVFNEAQSISYANDCMSYLPIKYLAFKTQRDLSHTHCDGVHGT